MTARGALFWWGLLVGCLSVAIYGGIPFAWLGVLSFGWLIYQDYPGRWMLFLFAALACGGWFTWQQQRLQPIRHDHPTPMSLRLHPDQYQVQDHLIFGRAQYQDQTVQIRGQLTPAVGQKLSHATHRQVLQATGVSQGLPAKRNPYDFDWRAFHFSQGIVTQVAITDIQTVRRESVWGWDWLSDQINTAHLLLKRWFEHLPPHLRDYGETLYLGYTRDEFYADNPGIQALGLMHLFSLSGFQVELLYVLWRWLCQRIGLYREDSLWGWQGVLVVYWAFAGTLQSLIRALLSSSLSALHELGLVGLDRLERWGLVLAGSVILQPGLLLSLGGQLSFLLSFGLLWLSEKPGWQVSIWLNGLITPLLLYHQGTWAYGGFVANLILLPVFTWGILPVVAGGCLAALVPSTWWLRDLCDQLIGWFQFGLAQLGAWVPEAVLGVPPLWWGIVTVVAACLWLMKIGAWTPKVVGLLTSGWVVWSLWGPTVPMVTFLDVGQGDTTIVQDAHRRAIVIDVGGQVYFKPVAEKVARQDAAKHSQSLVRHLQQQGYRDIEALVLTHMDADHIGNVAGVLAKLPVRHLWVSAGMLQHPQYQQKIGQYVSRSTQVHEGLAGMIITPDVEVVYPLQPGRGTNADSLSVLIQLAGRRILVTGDLDQAGERKLLARRPIGQLDVLKLGHHGSRSSTSLELVQQTRPRLGVVSAGRHNRYHHPHAEPVAQIQAVGGRIWQTAESGGMIYRAGELIPWLHPRY